MYRSSVPLVRGGFGLRPLLTTRVVVVVVVVVVVCYFSNNKAGFGWLVVVWSSNWGRECKNLVSPGRDRGIE